MNPEDKEIHVNGFTQRGKKQRSKGSYKPLLPSLCPFASLRERRLN